MKTKIDNADCSAANTDLTDIISVAVHDLCEPLRIVRTYAELLDRSLPPESATSSREIMQRIYGAVDSMHDLIRDLLVYTQVGPEHLLRLHKVALQDVVQIAVARVQANLDQTGSTLESALTPEVLADKELLAHVFQNLLSNAIKFRRRDVPLRIRITTELRNPDRIIYVSDNGRGFDPEYTEYIFNPFARLDGDLPGHGLGLAICRRIMNRHGGHMWATSKPGQGSVFALSLPSSTGQ
jgi:signal transduction histidine kinase